MSDMGRMLTSNSITNLIRSFGRREQALVQGLISDTRDPFYNLPIELLIYIFDFLHPYDVWSKRMICRRWNTVLSSDNFTRTALNRFETHDPADSALDPETHASSSNMLALRHTLALRNGRPFSYVNYGDQFAFLPNSNPVSHQLRLKGKHIAYLRGNADTCEGTTVVIRDLVTGETTSLCGTAREKIVLIELSTDIVAFFTYTGTVYVASLLGPPDSLRAVRLPSSKVYAAHADRGLLTCLLGGMSGLNVFIHDTRTRKSTSFSYHRHEYCDKNEDDHCHTVLITSRDKCIDVLSVVNSTDELKLHVKVVRYSLAGERTLQDRLTIWHGIQNLPPSTLGPILPTGERGLFQLALSLDGQWYGTVLFDADFNPNTNMLKMVDLKVQNTMLWKDRLYRIDPNPPLVLLDSAQRPAPFDGPNTLRALSNEAWSHPMTQEEKDQKMVEDDEQERQDKKNQRSDASTHWRSSAVRSWKGRTFRVHPRYMRMNHMQDQPPMLPGFEQVPATTDACYGPEKRQVLNQPALHTIVAMNDTFAVGTCRNSGYIGVVCFDERVELYGAGRTKLWADRDHHMFCVRPQSHGCQQFAPGLFALDRQKCLDFR